MATKKVGLNVHPYHFYVAFAWNAQSGHYCVEVTGKPLPRQLQALAKIVHRLGVIEPGDLWVYLVRGTKCQLQAKRKYDAWSEADSEKSSPDPTLFAYRL